MNIQLDPRYQEFSASLRQGKVFVKMPCSKASMLVAFWGAIRPACREEVQTGLQDLFDLLKQEFTDSQEYQLRSVFYQLPQDLCQKDIDLLCEAEKQDLTGIFRMFRETLEKGIHNDPLVDWISHVGGPVPARRETLEANPNLNDLDLSNLSK